MIKLIMMGLILYIFYYAVLVPKGTKIENKKKTNNLKSEEDYIDYEEIE